MKHHFKISPTEHSGPVLSHHSLVHSRSSEPEEKGDQRKKKGEGGEKNMLKEGRGRNMDKQMVKIIQKEVLKGECRQ